MNVQQQRSVPVETKTLHDPADIMATLVLELNEARKQAGAVD